MKELNKRDLYWTLRTLPRPVVDLMKSHSKLFLAGGFIRACVANETPQDIDLFAPDEERADLYAKVLAGVDGKVHKSKNAYTVRLAAFRTPVQVIHRWTFDRPETVIESFDFTVAKAMVWCAGKRNAATRCHDMAWESLCHDDFYSDLAAKRLVYTSPVRNEDAGGSMLRVLKFYSRGYRMPLDSLAAVTARLMEGVREDRLLIIDGSNHEQRVAQVLTGLLHEVDPLLDPEHVFHLPADDTDAEGEL